MANSMSLVTSSDPALTFSHGQSRKVATRGSSLTNTEWIGEVVSQTEIAWLGTMQQLTYTAYERGMVVVMKPSAEKDVLE